MGEVIKFKPVEQRINQLDNFLDIPHLTEMVEFLTALANTDSRSVDWRNIELRNPEKASKKELFTWVNRSTRLDWQKYPSFYHAIIAELKKRGLIK